jgi:hypothetical protein
MGSTGGAAETIREFAGWTLRTPSPDQAAQELCGTLATKDGLYQAMVATRLAARGLFAIAAHGRWPPNSRTQQMANDIAPPESDAERALIVASNEATSESFPGFVFAQMLTAAIGETPSAPTEAWQRAFARAQESLPRLIEYEETELGITAEPLDLARKEVAPMYGEYRKMRRRGEVTFEYD